MTNKTEYLLKLSCILVLLSAGPLVAETNVASISKNTMSQFISFINGIGSVIGSTEKMESALHSSELNMTSVMLDINSMMHGIGSPQGTPAFVDDKSAITAMENIIAKLGPFICMLPNTEAKQQDYIASTMGGLVGGIVGNIFGNEESQVGRAILSGVGSIAGAMGGMSGGMIEDRPDGSPGVKKSIDAIPHLIRNFGDMKDLTDGSFQPPQDFDKIEKSLLNYLAISLNNMGRFVEEAGDELQGREGQTHLESFEMQFRGVSEELGQTIKQVAGMAGTLSGVFGYVLTHIKQVGKGTSIILKSNLKSLRTKKQGRAEDPKTDIFSGIISELAEISAKLGGYTGVVGGMMGMILTENSNKSKSSKDQPTKDQPTDSPTAAFSNVPMFDAKKLQSNFGLLHEKLEEIMPATQTGHFSRTEEMCLETLSVGLSQFAMAHKFGGMAPDSLKFMAPYGGKVDSADEHSLPRFLMGSKWNGAWKNEPAQIQMAGNMKPEDFNKVIDSESINDNAILRFIDHTVRKKGLDSSLIQFVRGDLSISKLPKSDRQSIPMSVLAGMKTSLISGFSAEIVVDILTSSLATNNPERLKKFLKAVTDQTLSAAVSQIKELQTNDALPHINRDVSRVIATDLIERFEETAYSKICPFVDGVSVMQLENIPQNLLKDGDLLSCLNAEFKQLDFDQKRTIANVVLGDKVNSMKNITLEQIKALKSFASLVPSSAYNHLSSQDISYLINSGLLDDIGKHLDRKMQMEIFNVTQKKLHFKSSNETTTSYLKRLGSLICGISTRDVHNIVPLSILTEFKANWTNKCTDKKDDGHTRKEKECMQQEGLGSPICQKMKPGSRRNEKLAKYKHGQKLYANGDVSSSNNSLPLNVSTSLSGLFPHQIKNLSSESINASLPQFANDYLLSKRQKRALLEELNEEFFEMNKTDAADRLGFLLSEANLSRIDATQLNDVFQKRPDIFMQLSKTKKASLFKRLLANKGVDGVIASRSPFIKYMPFTHVQNTENFNMTSMKHVDWNRAQALEVVNLYKNENLNAPLRGEDIRALGRAAIGITCQDVVSFSIDGMVEVARAIDDAVGNDIPVDLANCVATKLYLCLKMHYKRKVDRRELISKVIPENILLIMPNDIKEADAHEKSCLHMVKRLGRANLNLLAPGIGEMIMEEIIQLAISCLAKHSVPKKDSTGQQKPLERAFDSSSFNFPPMDSSEDHTNTGEQETQKATDDTFSEKEVRILGNLACKLRKNYKLLTVSGVVEFSKIFPACLKHLDQDGIETLGTMISDYLKKEEVKEEILRKAGSLSPLVDADILNTLSDSAMSEMFKYMPSLRSRKRYPQVTGDKATTSLNIVKNFLIQLKDEPDSFNLDYNPIDLLKFASATAPKLIDYLKLLKSESHNSSTSADDADDSRALDYGAILHLGPAVLGLTAKHFDDIADDAFKDSIPLLGMYHGWSSEQLQIMKTRMNVYGTVDTWPSLLLQDMGSLALVLSIDDVASLNHLDVEAIGALSDVKWTSDAIKKAILDRYLQVNSKTIQQLDGIELIAFGDLLCGINVEEIPSLSDDALRFAAHHIGKIKCFNEDRLHALKAVILEAVGVSADKPVMLQELGVLAGAMTEDDFRKIKPIHSSFVSPLALRVIPASRILNAWNVSHFALMGTQNGAVIIGRTDIFRQLNNVSRNAVFRATFGSSAGRMASIIHMIKYGEKYSMDGYSEAIKKMLHSVSMLFQKLFGEKSETPFLAGPGFAFGLGDIDSFVRPPVPDLASGLSKNDFENTLGFEYLEDTRIINFINAAAGENENILNFMKGDLSLNSLNKEDIQLMPANLWEGMKTSQIREMSVTTLETLLDSDKASRDPSSMTKVLRKLDLAQFEEALININNDMKERQSFLIPWRLPITVQEVISKEYVKRLPTDLINEEQIDRFTEMMCPFVAGMPVNLIKKIPFIASKIPAVVNCFGQSYEDLTLSQRKSVVNWATQNVQDTDNIDITLYGKFMLDFPMHRIRKSLTEEMASATVNDGHFQTLDTLHSNFDTFAKIVLKTLWTANAAQFDDISFLDKLGPTMCDIPLNKVKSSMSRQSIMHLSFYTMSFCKSKEEMLEDSLQECFGDQAHRLRRCQLLEQEFRKVDFQVNTDPFGLLNTQMARISLETFKMQRELASILLNDKDLTQLNADEIQEAAGALGGLTPQDMEKLPDLSILEAISSIKDNKHFSSKQKQIMFKKARSAGLSFESESILDDLGELVSELPASEFLKVTSSALRNSLQDLKKKAGGFSRSQRKAIVAKLQEASVDDLLSDDLGAFAADIPLKKLATMEKFNITHIKDQAWQRGQAVKLVELYRNSSGEDELTLETISQLGSTTIGLKCSVLMDIQFYDMLETSVTIDSSVDMSPDMDECTQNKLHFSLQVDKGENYMTNDTDPDLEILFATIPPDVALFYPHELVNATPNASCRVFISQIGQAQLNLLPRGPGDTKREKLALAAINCLKRDPERQFNRLEESDVLTIGKLICDVPSSTYQNMTLDAFNIALELMHECLHRFTSAHIDELRTLVHTHIGNDSTAWDSTILSSLGPLLAMMSSTDILDLNQEHFSEAFDDIIPPTIDEDFEVYSSINYDAFYEKAQGVVFNQSLSRRKRAVSAPDFDDILTLGPGNSRWSVEQLNAIADDDLINALDVLGAVDNWSSEQMNVLRSRISEVVSKPLGEWSTETVADAKHILTELTTNEISSLDLTSMDTLSSLADLNWSNQQKTVAFETYMSKNAKPVASLTAEEIAGMSTIFCGMSASKMMSISVTVIGNALKDIGLLNCFDQDQFDALYALVAMSNDNQPPDAALMREMGSIAAGMTTANLAAIPVKSMAFLSDRAIGVMSPLRFKEGLVPLQLSAAGITNVAKILRTPRIYDVLSTEQQNAVQVAAYGKDARLANSTSDDVAGNEDNSIVNGPSGNTTETNDNGGNSSSTTSINIILFCLIAATVLIKWN
ncbi:uncharacterized protein LOC143451496 isoform X2 [Clavelina lepadiformis]|uniref:uncharacterized protein LOC143451496 isoform X2 n=1 Tax=Clavelina lepadiformis TaxID=159417 RepID=UPI004042C9CC